MRVMRHARLSGTLGLCLLGASLFTVSWRARPVSSMNAIAPPVPTPSTCRTWRTALQEARRDWGRAQMVVKPELEAWAARNPDAAPGMAERWRHRLTIRDHGGYLLWAKAAAQRALALAPGPDKKYEVILWLAIIECDRGRHESELGYVQRLVKLQPENRASWEALRRAAYCKRLDLLAKQADELLQAFEDDASSGRSGKTGIGISISLAPHDWAPVDGF
jgi:hypothetical protein